MRYATPIGLESQGGPSARNQSGRQPSQGPRNWRQPGNASQGACPKGFLKVYGDGSSVRKSMPDTALRCIAAKGLGGR